MMVPTQLVQTCPACKKPGISVLDKLLAGLPGVPQVRCKVCGAMLDAHFTVQSAALTAVPILAALFLIVELKSAVVTPLVFAIGSALTGFAKIHLTGLVH